MRHTGDPVASKRMAVRAAEHLGQQQALSLAYFDVFWVSATVAVFLVGLVLLMRRSVAERVHVAAE